MILRPVSESAMILESECRIRNGNAVREQSLLLYCRESAGEAMTLV